MRNTISFFCLLLFWLITTSCKESIKASSAIETAATDTTATTTNPPQGIREIGLLKQAEDSGYPFMTLTIEFPEKNRTESFVINLESVANVNVNMIEKAVGKYLTFEYDSNLDNMLYDLVLNDKSLFGEVATSSDEEILTITGKLSNAEEATAGDIPGQLYVTSADNEVAKFDFFITPEIVSANGKTVTAYYQKQVSNVITKLKVND